MCVKSIHKCHIKLATRDVGLPYVSVSISKIREVPFVVETSTKNKYGLQNNKQNCSFILDVVNYFGVSIKPRCISRLFEVDYLKWIDL